ncbi:LuxR C-terminal-related transcriptional regulator [Cellulomonas sp. S1-8]|uniref:LuxR C-terminal-related transcriptional regulator n=1 Tax=Cellulomonas sp. S1-8 TaxID=2904790 RepID=UPI002243B987|nr:LuxR C-terminal-related transcriptional regulator [Cellulomonas sp. S1-8]UZN03673.1 LuxR C-terminal-related transcriptional regulator [Cellulomonas sp. S1-8]
MTQDQTSTEPPAAVTAAARAHARSIRYAVPAVPPDLVPRERLVELVARGVRGPLTLVSASAGTGKTTLVSSWAARGDAPGPVAWITMDETDHRPRDFWAAVTESLVDAGLDLGPRGPRAGAAELRDGMPELLASGIAHRAQPLVLVLDEADPLDQRGPATAVGELLRRTGGRLRLVVLTRTDPLLPLHRYRRDGVVTEVRESDLAFDAGEQADLLRAYGLHLSDEGAATLLALTGGWAVGLRCAAMALAGRYDTEQAVRELRGGLAAYFVREVLEARPADVREVLLRTSIVDDLHPGLVEALAGVPARDRVLEFMSHGNAFIEPVPGSPDGFRYQSLFREFLRAQLAYERPALVPHLHRRAADWYARHDRPHEARRHAAAADLADAGRRYPPAAAVVPDGAVQAVATEPAILDHHGRADGVQVSRRLAVVILDAHRAYLGSDPDGGLTALAHADRLCGRLDPHTLAAHPEIPALLALCRGRLLLLRGDTPAAREQLVLATQAAESPGCEELLATSLRAVAVIDAAAGRLRTGADLLLRADATVRAVRDGLAPSSTAAAVTGAWSGMGALEAEAARRLERGAAAAHEERDEVTAAVLTLVHARLLVPPDRADRAGPGAAPTDHLPSWLELWLEAATVPPADDVPAVPPARQGAAPAAAAAEPLRRHSLVPVRRAPAGAGDTGRAPDAVTTSALGQKVTTWLAEAARAAESGDLATATAVLERALRLAAPTRLRAPFDESSPVVRRLLLELDCVAVRHPWLQPTAPPGAQQQALPRAAAPHRPQGDPVAVRPLREPLTLKETEVLGLLAGLLNTEEIAATMYVSVNTVRTHVRSILRKLGASRRNEAVRRAWELGILLAGDADARVPHEPSHAPSRVG